MFYHCDRVEVLGTANQCNRKSFSLRSYRKSLGGDSFETTVGLRRNSVRADLAKARKSTVAILPCFLEVEGNKQEMASSKTL